MTREHVEVACDESGLEGEKLVDGCTDVFCHASVALTVGEAEECMGTLRRMIRSPAVEYKAFHLQREKHRDALEWFLGAGGPIHGRANAFLVDRTYLLLLACVDRLTAVASSPPDAAAALYRAHRADTARWAPFLGTLNDLMRSGPVGASADTAVLVAQAGALARDEPPGPARHVLDLLGTHHTGLDAALRAETDPDPTHPHALDPLIPAVVRAVDRWGGAVTVIHHTQRRLTDDRIARIAEVRPALRGVRLADPLADLRVQVADLLAGVTRKAASDELAGHGDVPLTALLRGYVDRASLWCDQESWARLRGAA